MAELDIIQIPEYGENPGIFSGKQVTPAAKPGPRITTVMRWARLRIVVPSRDASQMIAAIERITVSIIWAVAIIATLGIVTATSLSGGFIIAIAGIELTGFAITLLATRWRRRRTS